ncbi:hypothetical protein O6H91_13G022600 [Diphasiastrum complanatum]|uniref:Uncharacterized protein n=1 Tax=Diphasiastrum complanatum TaxID=34168 RepID=A0ACC2BSV2_DIPCM|nr:hypothetical protein O6H91_13G022600 [Diphasiastrum complanatum]
MGFRLNSEKEWISVHTQNPYKRIHKEHCFWPRKEKTLRLKDARPRRTSDVMASGSIDGITRELFQSMCIHGGRTSSGLTKFEKRYLEHFKRTLEDGQTVVI